eukprot:gene57031-biopygen40808
MVIGVRPETLDTYTALQRGVQHLVFHGQVQLDGAAHRHDALGDGRGVGLHACMGQGAQSGDAAQDVGVLVLEFVEVHVRSLWDE